MTRVTVDASLVAAALFSTRRIAQARAILDDASGDLGAPTILRQEFYNAVHRGVRRSLVTVDDADGILTEFESLPIEYYDRSNWVPRAYSLAQRHRQSRIFDAIYYVCAEDLGAELWTCDRKFASSLRDERPPWLRLCPDDV